MEGTKLINICYGITSYIIIVIGLLSVLSEFPQRRWKSRVVYIIFYILIEGEIAWEVQDSTRGFVTDLQMIFNPIISLLLLKIFYKICYRSSLLCLWLYNMITDLLRIPLLTMRGVYEKTDVMHTNVLGGRNYWECIWNLLIIFIFIFVYRKWKTQIQIFVKKIENSWKMALFILCIDISALFLVMWMAGFFDGGYYSDFNLITNVLLILILLLLFIIYVFRSMYRYNKLEKTSLVEQKEILTKEYQFIRTYCEQEAKRLHEVKHTYLYLLNCIEEETLESAKKCLNTHLENTKNREWKIWTGFIDLDCILNYEYERMQKQKIKFTQKIELYKLPVKGEDMMIIMGNLLENAIEASMKCQIEERRIELTIQQINEIIFLDVKNSISDTVNLNGFQSQKADKIMHGWGMKNIKQIVDENHGEMQCAGKDGMFDVNIIFMEDKEYE